MVIKVAVVGVGRTGSLVARRLFDRRFQVVAAFAGPQDQAVGTDLGETVGCALAGINVNSSAELGEILDAVKPDVVVDFTSADAFAGNLPVFAARKLNLVVGTTGFNEKQMASIHDIIMKNNMGAVFSPNMSVGVNVFWKLCQEAAKSLKGYDVEIIDKHHRFKKDAPSGTALKAAQIIAETQGLSQKDFVYGRQGASLRKDGDIGIHAIRAGNIAGEHTVIFASQNERVELTHIAHSREAFADGVPKAVEFIKGRKGIYDMSDVLALDI
ncbi:MAG: 4-hydroxy-tetrahydrodipicolinate reductase [Candidatus Altiarchaeota archaeon]|nr:4-hydroxy-tetrahydrodipicolinate reductase [Candidatus Altiarchaeota archaeon]